MAANCTVRLLRNSADSTRGCDPVPDLVWDDLNDRHAWILFVAFVDAVFQIAEICRSAVVCVSFMPDPTMKAVLTDGTNVS